jgi:AraC family transcriptional regulator
MNSSAFLSSASRQPAGLPAGVFAGQPPSVPGQPNARADGRWETRFPAEAVEILDDVRRAMEWKPEDAHALALRLVALLTPPAEIASAGARGGLAPWHKRKVDRYLSEHLGRPVYIKEIADQVSLSVSHFCRAFRESYGATPHTHIMRLRLELAQRLMLTTQEPLSQIALACGMADQAHLSKLFRRGVGETPGAWRRRSLTDTQAEARCRHQKESRSVSAAR